MSGDGTVAGTTYQARVIAFVYAHILAQRKLSWFDRADDTPVAISGETSGPGDDALVECIGWSFELQAKHGMRGGAKLDEVLVKISEATGTGAMLQVVLVVETTASASVRTKFAKDLERYKAGRSDGFADEMERIDRDLPHLRNALMRLSVTRIDVDALSDPHRGTALALLESVLEEPTQSDNAWNALEADAGTICATKSRRTRQHLVDLLKRLSIQVKRPRPDDKWFREFDVVVSLLKDQQTIAAGRALDRVEAALASDKASTEVLFTLAHLRAKFHFDAQRYEQAIMSARRALDLKPEAPKTLVIWGASEHNLGRIAESRALADRALAADPTNPDAWGLLAHVCHREKKELPKPPPPVAASFQFRRQVLEILRLEESWTVVREMTLALLQEGHREFDVLYARIRALMAFEHAGTALSMSDVEEAERLCTEIVDGDPQFREEDRAEALRVRAAARRKLRKAAEAEQDAAEARKLCPDDPEMLVAEAQSKLLGGQAEDAWRTLKNPIGDKNPMVRLVRAQTLIALKRVDEARADYEASKSALDLKKQPRIHRLIAAEVAIELHDTSFAAELISSLSDIDLALPTVKVLQGRIAFSENDISKAIELYSEAQRLDPKSSAIAEIGSMLAYSDRYAEAIAVFSNADIKSLPSEGLAAYAAALRGANQLKDIPPLLDLVLSRADQPTWAMQLAAEIALKTEDGEAAVRWLTSVTHRSPSDVSARLELARQLVALRRMDEAEVHLAEILSINQLTPMDRMRAAHLLKGTGRSGEALAMAHRAYREGISNARIHQGFVSLYVTTPDKKLDVLEAAENSCVELRSDDGEVIKYIIRESEPIDPTRHEVDVKTARNMGIFGVRVGDAVVLNPGRLDETKCTVANVVHAIVHDAHDAMSEYERRFPGGPPFIQSIGGGKGSALRQAASIVVSLEEHKASGERLMQLYRSEGLPLGVVASIRGVPVPAVMNYIAASGGTLRVEWNDATGHAQSRATANRRDEIVMSRSALHTGAVLGILDLLGTRFKVICPRSLEQELSAEVDEAQRTVKQGVSTAVTSEAGIVMSKIPPGEPRLQKTLEQRQFELDWLVRSSKIEARPISSVNAIDSEEEEARRFVGESSFDAVALARERRSVLLADDLDLRLYFPGVEATSTASLLESLRVEGKIATERYDELLLELLLLGHGCLIPTRGLLKLAIIKRHECDTRRVFGRALCENILTPRVLAEMVIDVAKGFAVDAIDPAAAPLTVSYGLEGLSTTRGAEACARLLERVCRERCSLLPARDSLLRRIAVTLNRLQDQA